MSRCPESHTDIKISSGMKKGYIHTLWNFITCGSEQPFTVVLLNQFDKINHSMFFLFRYRYIIDIGIGTIKCRVMLAKNLAFTSYIPVYNTALIVYIICM